MTIVYLFCALFSCNMVCLAIAARTPLWAAVLGSAFCALVWTAIIVGIGGAR